VATRYREQLAADYTVRVATATDEGLAKLDERVDVVLLDRETPDVSETDVLSSIRERDLDCRVAIVTPVEPDVDVLELGFDAYITKPLTASTLSETVERLLERSRYDRLLRDYYAAVAEQATLEATASQAAPEESAEYRRLQADIEAMRAELADTMGGVSDDEDFIATIRRLSER
jgi:DNA-binding response OmpR family regulator